MRKPIFLGSLYTLFLLWQNRWFSKPLTEAEVNAYLDKMGENDKKQESSGTDQQASFHAFLAGRRRQTILHGQPDAISQASGLPRWLASRSENRARCQRPLQQSGR